MKKGANTADIKKIERMARDKVPAAKIAKTLKIDEKVVKSFMPETVSKK